MQILTISVAAAIDRMAKTLAPLVTNTIITAVAKKFGLKADGSNKHARLRYLLNLAWIKIPKRNIESLVLTITMESHSRHSAGSIDMTHEDVDAVVAELRSLGLDPHELSNKSWRKSLSPAASSKNSIPPSSAPAAESSIRPIRHEKALEHIGELLRDSVSPQFRGRQLEVVLHGVLVAERLSPTGNILNPGEELDRGFVLGDHHYLVECKWEKDSIGLPPVTLFMSRVRKKAEGTFGIFLSMSGFVSDINSKAHTGERLNCIGLSFEHFMAVLEGRTTWSDVVRYARREASNRSQFFTKPR